jgi:hypothetical protein
VRTLFSGDDRRVDFAKLRQSGYNTVVNCALNVIRANGHHAGFTQHYAVSVSEFVRSRGRSTRYSLIRRFSSQTRKAASKSLFVRVSVTTADRSLTTLSCALSLRRRPRGALSSCPRGARFCSAGEVAASLIIYKKHVPGQ